ncbi:hypothetical protein PR048_004482 [Dryococelus australis]|uniref:RNA-directed DNA polymerase n=1 Tax=Dryococelus australis TaxID=614101 RepID=A0ABQ9I7I1_9NEOP|nr:hypothetical protein PR048_004482 [Dryococelus australis]
MSYFDDIIVHGSTREESQHNLIACLDQLQKFDLHLNQQICSLFQEQIKYLGHVIEFNKISKSPGKVAAIVDMPRPRSTEDVRRFLGMVTYYFRFMHGASTITTPLGHLLCKNTIFKWASACEAAFLKLKQALPMSKYLCHTIQIYQSSSPSDVSPKGIAEVLSHIVDGHEHPIIFASRLLTAAEQNHSQLDREALTIIFTYLFGHHFKFVTDNQLLTRIFKHRAALPKVTAGHIQHYAAFLTGFNYTIDFKKGIENSNVDCLFRAPVNINNYTASAINNEVKQLCHATIEQISPTTVTYQLLKENTTEPDYIIESGILFHGQQVIVPASLQSTVLNELHRTHVGIKKMKQIARRYVYWKKIDSNIEHLVRSCSECVAINNSPVKAPSHPWEEPEHNWQQIHIDYVGPYKDNHFLVVADAKSKWGEILPCSPAPTSESSIEILKYIFLRNGFPEVMVSDNATNGLAECNVQTLKHRLATISNQNMPIHQKVREILFRYRQWEVSCGTVPESTDPNPTGWDEADKILGFSEGERVSARYYSNNKAHCKCAKVLKKLGKLQYLVKFDNSFHFKTYIDQL